MVGSLYIQSEYSMKNSTLKLERLFQLAKESGWDFVGIADDANLHALYKALKLSENYQIPVIIGMRLSLKVEESLVDFLCYAKDSTELKHLIYLSSLISMNSRLEIDDLLDELKQVTLVLPSIQPIFNDITDIDILKDKVLKIIKLIPKIHFGLSLQHEFNQISHVFYEIAKTYKRFILPTHQMNYASQEEKRSYDILKSIENTQYVEEIPSKAFINAFELRKLYKDYGFMFEHMDRLFGKTTYDYVHQTFDLPKYPTVKDTTSKDYLSALSILGLKKRLSKQQYASIEIYQKRLLYELDVIHQMGYDDYFLIVYDFVRFAKTNDILVGPGRGSAAGSLVAYCLGITEVDPIQYDLLFERFLNINRRTMPDIDLDFPDHKRDKVIEYVMHKYGKKHVVTISTFTTFAQKSSIRDIAKIMKIDSQRAGAILKSYINNHLDDTDFEAVDLIQVSKSIEGLPRQTGTHPAGIIISHEDLSHHIPLMTGPKEVLQSQLEASDLEALGFLKIDFLGLKNLSIIEDVLKLENYPIKLSDIPLDDPSTYQLLKDGDVDGIFQLESFGMRQTIRKMKPDKFEDIVALLALYRPGPMIFIDEYIERLHGKPYEGLDPSIDDILKPTYGIIIYQEQIMKILNEFAGFSYAEADIIRRAISKKVREVIECEKIRFIQRSNENGKDAHLAEKIYDAIERFADYGFNRSHSVAYALLAYQMAYLKTHYKASFMAVLMTNVAQNSELIKSYMETLHLNGIDMLPPDINLSLDQFIVKGQTLIAPLTMIKGIGPSLVQKIKVIRGEKPFVDYQDFKQRTHDTLNEKVVESLIYSHALDGFGLTKASLIQQLGYQTFGFESFIKDFKEKNEVEFDFEVLKEKEFEVFGFNIKYKHNPMIQELHKKYNIKSFKLEDEHVRTIGRITKVKVIETKQKQTMAFIQFESDYTVELILFPKAYEQYEKLLNEPYVLVEISKNKEKTNNDYIIKHIEKVKV